MTAFLYLQHSLSSQTCPQQIQKKKIWLATYLTIFLKTLCAHTHFNEKKKEEANLNRKKQKLHELNEF